VIKALNDQKYSSIRMNAAVALGQVSDTGAVESLITALNDKDSKVGKAAVSALGQIGDTRAVEALLIIAVRHKDWRVGEAAVSALSQIGDTRAVEALLIIAVKAILLKEQATKALVQIGMPAIGRLSLALKDKDADVRQVAAKVLGEIGNTRAVEPLIFALKDSDSAVRIVAIQSLGKIGDAHAVQPLIDALKDEVANVRRAATNALVRIDAARVVEPLIAALKDKDKEVRRVAAQSLGEIGNTRAVKPLITTLKDPDKEVRRAAAQSLGKIGDARAVEPLIAALKDKDTNPLWAELEGKRTSVRLLAARALSRIGTPAVEALIVALKDNDSDVRILAAKTLGEIGDARAVQPLLSALMDENAARQTIADALDKLGWKPGKTAEGAVYWIARGKWDRCVQIGAPAVEPLIAALKEWDVRCDAAVSLVKLYKSTKITPDQKQHILALRQEIINTSTHRDGLEHCDICGFGYGSSYHEDKGIRVEFPL
jgi:HEAT repeat protein